MIIMKFGGSSVGNSPRIRNVAQIIRSHAADNPVIVLSAFEGVTNSLISAANSSAESGNGSTKIEEVVRQHYRIIRELKLKPEIIETEVGTLRQQVRELDSERKLTPRVLDSIMSFGERMSVRVLAAYLTSTGLKAKACDAFDVGFVTDSNFGYADILPEAYTNIRDKLSGLKSVPVITGFIGKDRAGEVTTLGRGGSDYTASIVGAAMDAKEIQIWTNTDGVMTADPKIVSTAMNIEALSYEEEAELEALGESTLNPRGIRPAMEKNIPVRILNTFKPEHRGTLIHRNIRIKSRVASITYKKDINIISISASKRAPGEGFTRKILETFDRHGIPIKTLSATSGSISVIVAEKHNIGTVVEELGKIAKVTVMPDMAQVSLVGNGLMDVSGVAETLSSSLSGMSIGLIYPNTSKTNQSVMIRGKHVVKAVRLLHDTFFGR